MSKSIHFAQSVRGAIELTIDVHEEALELFKEEDGKSYKNIYLLRDALYDQLAQGHEMIKTGECDNWDWKKGCLGHELG